MMSGLELLTNSRIVSTICYEASHGDTQAYISPDYERSGWLDKYIYKYMINIIEIINS